MNTSAADLKRIIHLLSEIYSSLEPEEVLFQSLKGIVSLIGCEAGSIWELSEEEGKLFFRAIVGRGAENLKGKSLHLGEGIAGSVAASGKPRVIDDVRKSSEWNPDFDRASSFHTENLLTFPLKSRGKVIGVIQLLNKEGGFRSEDIELIENLAGPVAMALENARLYLFQKRLFKETALALATAIDKRDPYTGGHTKRVLEYSGKIGEILDIEGNELEKLELSAILHDVGKIGIPDEILRKKGSLTEEERRLIEKHPEIGAEIVEGIPGTESIVEGIKYHHERCDGSGYPDGLTCEEIPIFARIIAVADVYDALTSERPYRKALSPQEALDYLKEREGQKFWEEAVRALLSLFPVGK